MVQSAIHKVQLACIFLACMYLGACDSDKEQKGGKGGTRPAVLVEVEQVSLSIVAQEIEAIGTLEANESVVVTSTVTDIVSSVNFEDGQRVEKGDVLVTLSSDEQSAELDEALANLKESSRRLERLRSIGGTLASKSDIDLAQAQVDIHRGRLEAIKARLADRIVTAPFSGFLGKRQVSVGAVVGPNTPIARLDDIHVLKLDFSVPEIYADKLALGNPVKVESAAMPGTIFEGEVTFVDNRVDVATRSMQVRSKLENRDLSLFPGMLMSVSLFIGEEEALVVPEAALLQFGDRSSVYVVNDDNTATQRDIKIKRRMPGKVVLSEGLAEGEWVVTNGTLSLRSGSKVKIHSRQAEASEAVDVPSNQRGHE